MSIDNGEVYPNEAQTLTNEALEMIGPVDDVTTEVIANEMDEYIQLRDAPKGPTPEKGTFYVSNQLITDAVHDMLANDTTQERASSDWRIPEHLRKRAMQARQIREERANPPVHIPEYLLERSAARRKVLEERANPKNTTVVGKTLAERLFLTGVPECSIAASDAAKLAQERFDAANPIIRKLGVVGESGNELTSTITRGPKHENLHIIDTNGIQQRPVMASWLTERLSTTAGYPVRLGLIRSTEPNKTDKGAHPDDLKLIAEIRQGLSFPLVHFSRSSKAYCDYLQFYGEAGLSELEAASLYGWGEDDNGSRFDAVQLVIQQLKNDSTDSIKPLTDTLKLDERIASQIGKFNASVETIMYNMFEDLPLSLVAEYEKEYSNVDTGKYTTNVTVTGQVRPVVDDPLSRKLTIRQFPTSQPDGNWPTVTLLADQHGAVSFVDENDKLTEPTPADLELVRELLNSPVKQESSNSVMSYARNAPATQEEGFLPDTRRSHIGLIGGSVLTQSLASPFLLNEAFYIGTGKGIVWGGFGILLNKAVKRYRSANKNNN